MLLKYLGTSAQTSVETGYGDSITVNPGDIIFVHPDSKLDEKYPSKFEKVSQFGQTLQKRVTLASAGILTSNGTPLTLLAAPGAGYALVLDHVFFFIDHNSTAYTTNTTWEIRYTDGSGAKVTADVANLLTATADKNVAVRGVATELVPVTNAAIVVITATGNPAAGDSPVYATVDYRIIKL